MTPARTDLPTLTEVVNVIAPAAGGQAPQVALPSQAESVALDDDAPGALPFEPTRTEPYLPSAPARAAAAASLPSLTHDEELVAQVMVRLQPRLEAWIDAQVRRALMEMLPVWAESASLTIVRDLRAEMPELLSVALDEVHRQRHG
jgi:hypothetical protein